MGLLGQAEQSFTRARPGPERRGLVRADGGIAPIENEGSLPRESSQGGHIWATSVTGRVN